MGSPVTIAFSMLALAAVNLCGESTIDCRSLNRDVAILGQLGVPLGKIVEIDASIVTGSSKEDDSSYLLKVTKVGPNLLKSAPVCHFVTHSWAEVKIANDVFSLNKLKTGRKTGSLSSTEIEKLELGYVGSTYRLLVYEEGGFHGVPADLPEDYPIWQDGGFRFETVLVVLRILDPTKQPNQSLKTPKG